MADKADDAAGVDDRIAFGKVRERGLRHVEVTEDVRLESSAKLFFRYVFKLLLRHLVGGVIDEDVQPAQLFHRPL
jgi:hypothetical protein